MGVCIYVCTWLSKAFHMSVTREPHMPGSVQGQAECEHTQAPLPPASPTQQSTYRGPGGATSMQVRQNMQTHHQVSQTWSAVEREWVVPDTVPTYTQHRFGTGQQRRGCNEKQRFPHNSLFGEPLELAMKHLTCFQSQVVRKSWTPMQT